MRQNFKTSLLMLLLPLALSFASFAKADATYSVTNPTYIPTAVSPLATYTAPADYVLTTHNIATTTLQISGTCTSLAAVVEGTNQLGATPTPVWTGLKAWPIGGGAAVSSFSAAGFWRIDTAGLSQVRLHITALTASCKVTMSGAIASSVSSQNYNDPCANPTVAKSSVAINQASSTTAAIVAAVASKVTYVCGFAASAVGTNPTFSFVNGTRTTTDCDTGAAANTGDINPSATVGVVSFGAGSNTLFTSGAVTRQLCLTTGATTDVDGVLTYVQQ